MTGERPSSDLPPERVAGAGDLQAVLNVSRETIERLEVYASLLRKWNPAINLVGASTLSNLWQRHIWDSAQLFPLLPPLSPDRSRVLVDLGSGAGLPGLILAILGAGAVHLVESDSRKAAFLREAARATETEAELHPCRAEALVPFPADAVTARALASLTALLPLAAPFLSGGGIGLFLKGARLEDELTGAEKEWSMAFDLLPSRSDASGRILRLHQLRRRG
ncbi:MAG: 16S rRNA (guanine(527)-N(7))-methyltransferase RsmG [Kiloniellales bacterium]